MTLRSLKKMNEKKFFLSFRLKYFNFVLTSFFINKANIQVISLMSNIFSIDLKYCKLLKLKKIEILRRAPKEAGAYNGDNLVNKISKYLLKINSYI